MFQTYQEQSGRPGNAGVLLYIIQRRPFSRQTTRTVSGAFILPLVLTMFCGCTPSRPRHAEEPVIKVNHLSMKTSGFAKELIFRLKTFDPVLSRKEEIIKQAKEQIINEFIIQSIVEIWAQKNSVTVSEKELQQAYEKLRANYPDTPSLIEALSQEGLSEKDWKSRQAIHLLQRKVLTKINAEIGEPTEIEIKNYYQQHLADFLSTEAIWLRQIVSSTEAAAKQILSEIKARKISFKQAAKKYSIAPESKAEGLVGWIERGTVEVFDSAFSYSVGKVSNVRQSPYGWHIFRVEKRRAEKKKSISDVKSTIKKILRLKREQAKFTDWLDNQVRLSNVHINEKLINAILVETRKTN